MRSRRYFEESTESSFELSISDLMSALCCIFVLILVIFIFQLKSSQAEYAAKNGIAEKYSTLQTDIYQTLNEEFSDEEKDEWKFIINPDLTIRFYDVDVMFDGNKSDLKEKYKVILAQFFPRLLNVITSSEYVDSIDEIRIEGHSARVDMDEKQDYREGFELSNQRTMNVLLFCLNETQYDTDYGWVMKKLVSNGYSFSRPVLNDDGNIDRNLSRRVDFRIKTYSDHWIEEFTAITKEFE